jgi:hypothetical protein
MPKNKKPAKAKKKPYTKALKKAQLSSTSPKITHQTLDKELLEIGEALAARLSFKKETFSIPDLLGHKDNFFRKIFLKGEVGTKKSFGAKYRDVLSGHDELLSTSATRGIIEGALKAHKKNSFSSGDLERFNELINNISRVRLPTRFSGFSTSTIKFQHPGPEAPSLFDNPFDRESAKLHSRLDLIRKYHAVKSFKKSLKNSNASPEAIVKQALGTVVEFTLKYFTAPAGASDISPNLRLKNQLLIEEQNMLREQLKNTAETHLNLQRAVGADTHISRPFGNPFRQNVEDHVLSGTISPIRNPLAVPLSPAALVSQLSAAFASA